MIEEKDQIEFIKKNYDHVRSEMIEHMKARRTQETATLIAGVVVYSWLLTNGDNHIIASHPLLVFLPTLLVAVSLLRWPGF